VPAPLHRSACEKRNSGNFPPEPTAGNANSPAPQVKGAGPSAS
jgi:hypothetical protein